ncbi:MAG: LysM peptidoglycan-binding domain-containing protein [Rikenellaceae bacterium]
MKKIVVCLMFLLTCAITSTNAQTEQIENQTEQRSQSIVYINGARFYVHTITEGETLYSLSKLYDVSISDIESNNASLAQSGLQIDQNIKIPISTPPVKNTVDRKERRNFNTHKVQKGETLYSISRKHALSVAIIVEDNPSIDPLALSVGQELRIRKAEVGKTSQEETIEELSEYQEKMNEIAPEGYEYHLVKPKETLYSILRNTNMSQQEFAELNNMESSNLKAGSIVIVRTLKPTYPKGTNNNAIRSSSIIGFDDNNNDNATSPQVQFSSLRHTQTLNVSLLLPLTSTNGAASPIFEEFYQGFLLGVEELKKEGKSVNVNLFDTKRSSSTVSEIVESDQFKASNLIVGPVYEDLMGEVVKYAESHSIPVVSPLAALNSVNSEVVFQMAPVAGHRYDKVGGLLADSVQVTLVYTENTDTQYEEEVKALLGSKPYNTHLYKYEHPSVVTERQAIAAKYNREPEHSPSDLSPIINGDAKDVTIFVMSDNETDVDRILSALASAEIGLRSRSLKVSEFSVFYNSKWNRYNNIDRAVLFRDRVVAFTSYHAKRDNDTIKHFDSRYAKAFGVLPSLYSYRGYDVAKIFGEGLYSDIDYSMEGRTFTPLQTTYRFQKINGSESRANQNWMRVNYKKDFTITLE